MPGAKKLHNNIIEKHKPTQPGQHWAAQNRESARTRPPRQYKQLRSSLEPHGLRRDHSRGPAANLELQKRWKGANSLSQLTKRDQIKEPDGMVSSGTRDP